MNGTGIRIPAERRLRGKGLAACLLGASCALTTVAAYAGRGYLEDSWWIWKLGSEDRAVRIEAAEKLAERQCIRAAPKLVKAIVEDSEEGITTRTGWLVWAIHPTPGTDESWETFQQDEATPVVFALWLMGEPALPSLKRCLGEMPRGTRPAGILERLLDRSKPLTRKGWVVCK